MCFSLTVLLGNCRQDGGSRSRGCGGYLPARPEFAQAPYKGPSSSIGDEFKCALVAFFRRCLRTVPTVVIAHTFCASRDTRISYCWCLLIQGYFCAVQNYAEKAELSK